MVGRGEDWDLEHNEGQGAQLSGGLNTLEDSTEDEEGPVHHAMAWVPLASSTEPSTLCMPLSGTRMLIVHEEVRPCPLAGAVITKDH